MNADAFRDLYLAHRDAAQSFMLGLCGDTDEAQEVVQKAFVKIFNTHFYDEKRNFKTWFFTVLKNTYLDQLKSYYKRMSIPLDNIDAPDRENILLAIETAHQVVEVRRILNTMTPEHRAVLLLTGRPYAEIARAVGVSRNTVGPRINRARKIFRRLYHG